MTALKDSKTLENLKDAFAGERQANRPNLYFAQKADVEGYNEVAGHAPGHIDFRAEGGDPATG